MHLSRSLRRGVLLVALLALTAPLTAFADHGKRGNDRDDWRPGSARVFYATDTGNNLLRFQLRQARPPAGQPDHRSTGRRLDQVHRRPARLGRPLRARQ